ncbi:hypothetical protein ITI46_29445 [Streptomyces oryzae]|uniref:Integral membrane protein n=1 Tax=Streptomyces oryzae TaxID=1434886 RepID=A0ABS3XKA1_9ACTN|nr:hypothetical protein [Streptomyces oryzae]MBO8195744.1 hypothetical protein [Streptomyces oryzae]
MGALVDGVDDANDDGSRANEQTGAAAPDVADTLVLDPVQEGGNREGAAGGEREDEAEAEDIEAALQRQRRTALARRRSKSAAALVLLAAGYLLQVAGIVDAHAPLVVLGAALGLLTEVLMPSRARKMTWQLRRAQFNPPARQMLRDALLLGGLGRLDVLPPGGTGAVLLGAVMLCWALHFCCQAVAGAVRTRRRLPVVTRNIDASALGLSTAPPALFVKRSTVRLTAVSVLTTGGMCAAAVTGDLVWAQALIWCCCAGVLAGTGWLATWLLPGKQLVGEEEALAWLDQWLAEYGPTVGMYFSGGASSAYQANMWLSTLAQLDGRPLIVLRERCMVQKIDATDIPVVCIPKVTHLMRLEHSTLKVLLHPANSGKTAQVLRIPTLKHAFINHGESDKLSSCNPYAKAYDQVWVAGEAARERYAQAYIGVEDKDVVEVGRPQLAPIQPAGTRTAGERNGYLTVLYAPTWEGFTDDPGNTSVLMAGENIVRALLADPKVRLLYKPHPMTGTIDPRAGAADKRIRALVREANAEREADIERQAAAGQADARRDGEEPGPEAVAALEDAARELRALTRADVGRHADEVERMLRQTAPEPGRAQAAAEALRVWEEAYWAAKPCWGHRVITGSRPGIYSCFNEADVLVSDVSSVVSDYLSSEKPYAVANTSGMDDDSFRTACPTVRAATILGPDGSGIPQLLHSVRHPEEDTLAPARAALKVRLLGPAEPPSLVRFNRAVQALAREAAAREQRMRAADCPTGESGPVPVPEPETEQGQAPAEALGEDERP